MDHPLHSFASPTLKETCKVGYLKTDFSAWGPAAAAAEAPSLTGGPTLLHLPSPEKWQTCPRVLCYVIIASPLCLFIANLPGMWERTVTIGSAGKTFSATGWKVRTKEGRML